MKRRGGMQDGQVVGRYVKQQDEDMAAAASAGFRSLQLQATLLPRELPRSVRFPWGKDVQRRQSSCPVLTR